MGQGRNTLGIYVQNKDKNISYLYKYENLTEHLHECLSEKVDSFSKFQHTIDKSYLRYPLLHTSSKSL